MVKEVAKLGILFYSHLICENKIVNYISIR